MFVLLALLCTTVSATPITFINHHPYTKLGIAKFILDENGEQIDYEILNIRWTDEVKVVDLEPGLYGITQYRYWTEAKGIVVYVEINVNDEPFTVIFKNGMVIIQGDNNE